MVLRFRTLPNLDWLQLLTTNGQMPHYLFTGVSHPSPENQMRQYEFTIAKDGKSHIVFCTAQTADKAYRAVCAAYSPGFTVKHPGDASVKSHEAHRFYCEIDATAPNPPDDHLFTVGGIGQPSMAEMLMANPDNETLRAFVRTAKVGDVLEEFNAETVVRIA